MSKLIEVKQRGDVKTYIRADYIYKILPAIKQIYLDDAESTFFENVINCLEIVQEINKIEEQKSFISKFSSDQN